MCCIKNHGNMSHSGSDQVVAVEEDNWPLKQWRTASTSKTPRPLWHYVNESISPGHYVKIWQWQFWSHKPPALLDDPAKSDRSMDKGCITENNAANTLKCRSLQEQLSTLPLPGICQNSHKCPIKGLEPWDQAKIISKRKTSGVAGWDTETYKNQNAEKCRICRLI